MAEGAHPPPSEELLNNFPDRVAPPAAQSPPTDLESSDLRDTASMTKDPTPLTSNAPLPGFGGRPLPDEATEGGGSGSEAGRKRSNSSSDKGKIKAKRPSGKTAKENDEIPGPFSAVGSALGGRVSPSKSGEGTNSGGAGEGQGSPKPDAGDGVSSTWGQDSPSKGGEAVPKVSAGLNGAGLTAAAEAGPSTAGTTPVPSAPRRQYNKKNKKMEGLISYTTAFVPGLYNIKNPAGDFAQKESNVEVVRQLSQARAKAEKAAAEEERQRRLAAGEEVPEVHSLAHTLIIHPGSRNLRFGRASDFYPKEVPNCIARPVDAPHRGFDPPVPGSRAKRIAREEVARWDAKRRTAGDGMEMDDDEPWMDPVDMKIGYLRDYLRNKLRANRLSTDWKEGSRVNAANQRVKPDAIPEHNDPYRIDWTEVEGKHYFVGNDALRLPESSGFRVRYPILHRTLNTRDWKSPQLLLDDIAIILQESLREELDILPKDYPNYSVVFIVPDHGDRIYVQAMTHLLLSVMGFKEIAVHQEAYAAIFSAGMSSACVVDIGAQQTSVTCVDEGMVNADTRIKLNYGGDDITSSLVALLQRSSFPYRELDLARSQDWLMMDNLKIKICTLEEHLVANTPWDFYVLKTEGLTQKYLFRTYDENILAPLCFFDTRLIDFEEKKGNGSFPFWGASEDISDTMSSPYDEPTGAMKACIAHLLPAPPGPPSIEPTPVPNGDSATPAIGSPTKHELSDTRPNGNANGTSGPALLNGVSNGEAPPTPVIIPPSGTATPVPELPLAPTVEEPAISSYDIIQEAAKSPLDAVIAASISMCGTENKVKAAASSILLIGGSGALKGLGAFIAERLPPLLRAKNFPIADVQIVPPPRNLNPRFVSWKGASVMCNLDSLSDMWIRRDEWEEIGPRALKERCLFL